MLESRDTNSLLRWNPALRVAHQRANGEPVVVLHDPRSEAYYQLGAEEYAIAQVFDGSRSLADVHTGLAAQGSRLELEELEAFAAQLLETGLLIPAERSATPPSSTPRFDPSDLSEVEPALERWNAVRPAPSLAGGPVDSGWTQEVDRSEAFEEARPTSEIHDRTVQHPPPSGQAPRGDTGLRVAERGPTRSVAPAPAVKPRRRWLELELAAFQAGDFFERGVRAVRPFFSAPALLVAAAAVGLAAGITAARAGELAESVHSMFSAGSLVALWAVFAGIVVLHEMAHGFVCAHFGGRVGALGFLMLYGKPCAYCDVSDAWMLPKRQRLWIMAAGSLLELALWAFATLVWRVAAPETMLHHVALMVLVVTGFGTLFNFNPLIRFDGYYMLSDWLEIPNLRQRAFGELERRLLGRPLLASTPREQRIFLVYGVVALVYTALLVAFLFVRVQGGIATRWGGFGVVLFWGVVLLLAARPGQRFLVAWAASVGRTRVRRLVILGGVALVAVLLATVRWPLKVAADCRIEPRARVVLRSPVQGTVETVRGREGDVVRAGMPLIQLATRDLDFALASARAEADELVARLAMLESGPRRQEIELAERRAEEAAMRVRFQKKEHDRAAQSLASDLVSQQSVDAAERELRVAEDDEAAARKSLELLRAGARREEVQAMAAKLESMRAQVARLEDDRSRTSITAPIDGQVLSDHPERLVGRYVERGDSLLLLADMATVQLEIPVPEKEVGDVVIGAPVRFKARSLPGRTFEGRVVGIAPAAEQSAHQRTVIVRSELDNHDSALRAGTSGYAKIYCGERRLAELLGRRAVRTLRTEFWALF